MRALELVRQTATGLGNDFDAALDQPALAPVGFEGVDRDARHLAADVLDRLENIGEPRRERRCGHQNTCSADASIRGRRTLWRLSRVMISALRPRMREACSFTSINWKRPRLPRS